MTDMHGAQHSYLLVYLYTQHHTKHHGMSCQGRKNNNAYVYLVNTAHKHIAFNYIIYMIQTYWLIYIKNSYVNNAMESHRHDDDHHLPCASRDKYKFFALTCAACILGKSRMEALMRKEFAKRPDGNDVKDKNCSYYW